MTVLADVEVGVVVGCLGSVGQADDEGDGTGEGVQAVPALDHAVPQFPPGQVGQRCPDRLVGQSRHLRILLIEILHQAN